MFLERKTDRYRLFSPIFVNLYVSGVSTKALTCTYTQPKYIPSQVHLTPVEIYTVSLQKAPLYLPWKHVDISTIFGDFHRDFMVTPDLSLPCIIRFTGHVSAAAINWRR
mmetsp:Transcript_70033/g.113709  ORF Transcript_70033/g.113709 Transcript_70033/m.113709 type:complete len:109 (-) Transcript_70033:361-687(-)